jgi:hypothetical protein
VPTAHLAAELHIRVRRHDDRPFHLSAHLSLL